MAAIRQVRITHFRGFSDFTVTFAGHAVVVGEPGAGRTDLIEALTRTLDVDYLRNRRGDELDFHALDTSAPAEVEVTIGSLRDTSSSPLLPRIELWDRQTATLVPELVEAADFDAGRHEEVFRLTYRLEAQPDGTFDEYVYWPKSARPTQERAAMASAAERAETPFFSAKSIAAKPIDLAVRSQFRKLTNSKAGEDVERAVDRLLDALEEAAEEFSTQERIADALSDVLAPLRTSRRMPPTTAASELIRFLPAGGARTGILRSLDAAIQLTDGVELPVDRHGTNFTASLRAGLLLALAGASDDVIIVADDFGSDLEPLLARHLAERLRTSAAQVILTSRQPHLAAAFRPEEIVRLSAPGARVVGGGTAINALAGREVARFLTTQLIPAMTAAAVVITDGPHDRLALEALGRRLVSLDRLASFPAAGIALADAEGTGSLRPLAISAKALQFYTVVLLDNDQAPGVAMPQPVADAANVADLAILLPPRMALERLLFAGVDDAEIIRVLNAIGAAYTGVTVPANLATLSTADLRRTAAKFLKQTPSLHAAFVEELADTQLCPGATAVLELMYDRVAARATGLIRLQDDFTPAP